MKKIIVMALAGLCCFFCQANAEEAKTTRRVAQFSNDQVTVWKTIIYPTQDQHLKMHQHEYNRVVVALTDGKLKITNDKHEVHYLNLKKGKAYYLPKDVPNELHMDENISGKPITVMVIELKEDAHANRIYS